jgi:hypothetical protein
MLDGMWPWVASTFGIESDDSDGVSKYKDFLCVYIQEWLFSPSYELSAEDKHVKNINNACSSAAVVVTK